MMTNEKTPHTVVQAVESKGIYKEAGSASRFGWINNAVFVILKGVTHEQ